MRAATVLAARIVTLVVTLDTQPVLILLEVLRGANISTGN
jgi:hypothetical protein